MAAVILTGAPIVLTAGPAQAQGCPSGTDAVASYHFVVNGRSVAHMSGTVHSGDHMVAVFTLDSSCRDVQISLASYQAPGPTFDRNTADQQVLYRSDTGSFGSGEQHLAVDVPAGYFQVDFVRGPVIARLGPANSNNFYGDQGRLIEGVNGGTTPTPVPTSSLGLVGLGLLLAVGLAVVQRSRPRGRRSI